MPSTNGLAFKRKHGGISTKPKASRTDEKSLSADSVRKYAHAFIEGGSGANDGITSCTLRTIGTENKRLLARIAMYLLENCDKRQVAHAFLDLVSSNIDSLSLHDYHKTLLQDIQTERYNTKCEYK